MLDMDDNALIAHALREHAQTCDDIASKYHVGASNRAAWQKRAEHCRTLARQYAAASEAANQTNSRERGRA